MDNILRLIEDAARTSAEVDPRNPPNQMFQASIALSLKRIADMMERAERGQQPPAQQP